MWKGKKANTQERKGAMSHAQVGMGVEEEENCEETPAGGGKQGQKGVQRPGKALDSTQLEGGISELVL